MYDYLFSRRLSCVAMTVFLENTVYFECMGGADERWWRQTHPHMNDDIKDTQTIVIDFDRGISDFEYTAKQIQNLLKTGHCYLHDGEMYSHNRHGGVHNAYDFSQVKTLMLHQNISYRATAQDFLRFVSTIFQKTQIMQMSFLDYQTRFWSDIDGSDILACVPPNHTFLLRKNIHFEGTRPEYREHRGVDYPEWMHNHNMGGQTPHQGRCMMRVGDLYITSDERIIQCDYQTITTPEVPSSSQNEMC